MKPTLDELVFGSVHHRLDRIESLLKHLASQLSKLESNMAVSFADLKAKVEAEHTVELSAIALLQQISQMLKDAQASGDPAAIQEVMDMLDANTKELSDAVTANTPAA